MVILVSGGTGFMGSAISRHLLAAGHTVRILTRSPSSALSKVTAWPGGKEALEHGRLELFAGDVTKPSSLPAALAGCQIVIQAAQFPGAPVENPKKGYTYDAVDRAGTVNLVEAAQGTGSHIVYLSGIGVTGDPRFPWIKAKREAEEAVRGSGCPWTIVRSSWAYGPGDRSLNRLLGYARRLPFLPFFGDGRALVTPVYVEDVGRLFAKVADSHMRLNGQVIPLGGPDVVTINEMLRTAMRIAGIARPILHLPLPLGRMLGWVAQFMPGRPLTPGAVDFVAQGGVADLATLKAVFADFDPLPLEAGLSLYLRNPKARTIQPGQG